MMRGWRKPVLVLAVAFTMSACNDPREAARLNAMSECTATARIGDAEMPKLSPAARAACMERVRNMPRPGFDQCEELVRNDEGVWEYKLGEQERAECKRGDRGVAP